MNFHTMHGKLLKGKGSSESVKLLQETFDMTQGNAFSPAHTYSFINSDSRDEGITPIWIKQAVCLNVFRRA